MCRCSVRTRSCDCKSMRWRRSRSARAAPTSTDSRPCNGISPTNRRSSSACRSRTKQQEQLVQLAALKERLQDAEVKRAYEQQLAARRAKEKAAAEKAAARAAA